jgi:2-methylcitrate dehydratase
MQITFNDGSKTEKIAIEYPIGHRKRRSEGVKVLNEKFARNLSTHYEHGQTSKIIQACHSLEDLKSMDVLDFMNLWS